MYAVALSLGLSSMSCEAQINKAQPDAPRVYSHVTAPTHFIIVDGTRYAYRRFGKPSGRPLIFFQHFLGNMDNWDPMVVDGFAKHRQVILFDNAGVAASGGEVPSTVEGMANNAISFIEALGIKNADLLGFSLGSLVAQQITLDRPDLVHRVILVGSGPRGGIGMASLTPEFRAVLAKKRAVPDELLLDALFTPSAKSQAAGREFLDRERARTVNRDIGMSDKVEGSQVAAFAAWGAPRANNTSYLEAIKQPVLIIGGSNDIVHYTINSYELQQHLPDAELIIYPDTNHGSFYQYPALFLESATTFLNSGD